MAGAGSRSGERKAHILQAFAAMLEQHPGGRITTAALAREVGVSEAALYRHFASKAQMFEGLIAFLEETVLGRVPTIKQELVEAPERCGALLTVLLSFCAKNPGFARLLTGDVLAGKRSACGNAWPSSLSASKPSFASSFATGSSPRARELGSPQPSAPTLCWRPPRGALPSLSAGGSITRLWSTGPISGKRWRKPASPPDRIRR